MMSSLLVLASRLSKFLKKQDKIRRRLQNQDKRWLFCLCLGQMKHGSQCFKQKRSTDGERRTAEKLGQSSGKRSRLENSRFLFQTMWHHFAEQLWKGKSAKVGLILNFLMEILKVLLSLKVFKPIAALSHRRLTLPWDGGSLVPQAHRLCCEQYTETETGNENQQLLLSSVLGT